MTGPSGGALSVRVQSCTGKTVQLEFLPRVLGGEVLQGTRGHHFTNKLFNCNF